MQHILQNMEQWCRGMPGAMLCDMERDLLARVLSHIFGDVLIQVGGRADMLLIQDSPIKNHIYFSPFSIERSLQPCVQTELDELPVSPSSVDVFVIAHMLEFVDQPSVVLQEIYTALQPNGQLIIFGFNPWSLWGLARHYRGHRSYPWQGKFHSAMQVRQWLRQIGYRIISSKSICFRPPLVDNGKAKKLLFMEALGQVLCPSLGAAYMITAQKREYGVTPLQIVSPIKKIRINGQFQPTTRVI